MAPVQSLPGEPWRFLAKDEMAQRAGSNDKFLFLSSTVWQALLGASKTAVHFTEERHLGKRSLKRRLPYAKLSTKSTKWGEKKGKVAQWTSCFLK